MGVLLTMILHKDKETFKSLLEVVSEHYGIDIRIVEKDYWVSYTLSKLLTFDRRDLIIFRGGTSLTKCYTDLRRFSEDIDLAVNKERTLTPSQLKKLITDVEKYICVDFQESQNGVNRKSGNYRNVEYKYPTLFEETALTELNSRLKIETVTFLTPNPYEKRLVKSIVYDFLIEKGFNKYIDQYELHPFELNVLSIKRTLMDKIVSLVRMSYKDDLSELLTKTRHLYDLHLTYETVKEFYLNKDELKSIITLVRQDEEVSDFKNQYPYQEKWSRAPIWNLIEQDDIRKSYEENFGKEFVYGELPNYSCLLKTLKIVQQHLEGVGE